MARRLIDFVDTDSEIIKWQEYWESCDQKRKLSDIKFIEELNSFISLNGQKDKSLEEILTICNDKF